MRIVFFGTPDFAVASLQRLVEQHYDIVAVVTAPDKPAGRGMQLQASAVKQYALATDLPVLQPEKLKDPAFIETLRQLNADLFIVIAFRMLPEVVWTMPPIGTFNLHASLLPAYRGAAPINWAIINGERETGLTTFFLKHEIDTGDILFQTKVAVPENMTAGELHDVLMHEGAALVVKTVDAIANKNYTLQNQVGAIKHAPKLFKEHAKIDWAKPTASVYNLIRGLSPYPAAFTYLNDKVFKLYTVVKLLKPATEAAGTPVTDHKTYLRFATADGYIDCLEVQLEGKKRMPIKDFLAGYKWT